MEEDQEPAAPPTRGMKLLAVFTFFFVLFVIANVIGLPIPMPVVTFFFLTVAAPLAFFIALLTAAIFRFIARATGRIEAWPFFDVALQTFIFAALIASGLFVVQFPKILEESYPSLRETVEGHLSSEIPADRREGFLQAFDRFWVWNTTLLLDPEAVQTEVDRQSVEDAMQRFREALVPACAECPPELTGDETRELTALMNKVTGFPEAPTAATEATGVMAQSVTGATGVTAPAEAPSPVTGE